MNELYEPAVTCCFTGHRPAKLPWGNRESDDRCRKLKASLNDVLETLYDSGMRWFLSGMALGCDTYFAEAVIRLRRERPDAKLEAVIPCVGQQSRWSTEAQNRYTELVSQCDRTTVLEPSYSTGCMLRRNLYMIRRSGVLLAVYDGSPGGTQSTVNAARKSGLEVICLRP